MLNLYSWKRKFLPRIHKEEQNHCLLCDLILKLKNHNILKVELKKSVWIIQRRNIFSQLFELLEYTNDLRNDGLISKKSVHF